MIDIIVVIKWFVIVTLGIWVLLGWVEDKKATCEDDLTTSEEWLKLIAAILFVHVVIQADTLVSDHNYVLITDPPVQLMYTFTQDTLIIAEGSMRYNGNKLYIGRWSGLVDTVGKFKLRIGKEDIKFYKPITTRIKKEKALCGHFLKPFGNRLNYRVNGTRRLRRLKWFGRI